LKEQQTGVADELLLSAFRFTLATGAFDKVNIYAASIFSYKLGNLPGQSWAQFNWTNKPKIDLAEPFGPLSPEAIPQAVDVLAGSPSTQGLPINFKSESWVVEYVCFINPSLDQAARGYIAVSLAYLILSEHRTAGISAQGCMIVISKALMPADVADRAKCEATNLRYMAHLFQFCDPSGKPLLEPVRDFGVIA